MTASSAVRSGAPLRLYRRTWRSIAGAVQAFARADEAFANLVRVEKAAGMSDEGIFTPQQLKNAVRSFDRSARKGTLDAVRR
jgi:hypothetical protein